MPLRPTRSGRTRWVTAASLAVVTALTAASCTDVPEQKRSQPRLPNVSPGDQPVASPSPQDAVLPEQALTRPDWRQPRERPNLLLITMDDAALGDLEHMPLLQESVADQGVTLDQGLAPTPICVPARASLLTGQYAANHGAVTINGEGGGFDAFEDDDTLPVWLRDAGYDTFFMGKYLNGYGTGDSDTYVPPGWTDWQGMVDPTTYNFAAPTINDNGVPGQVQQYSTDLLRDQTVEALESPERQERPWYMWVNYVAPHTGGPTTDDDPSRVSPDDPDPIATTSPAEEDRDTFTDLELPRTPDVFEEDVSDKVMIKSTHRPWDADKRAQAKEAHQQRIEALQSVDRAIAATVDSLRETGQLRNTYVVVTSDNGFVLGSHNLEGKLWYFRDIVGIPMMARGPGLPRGVHNPTPVTNADWAPTFAALAGATPTREVDGVDVMPWLAADPDDAPARRVVPVAGYPVKGGLTPLYSGVVVGPWTYVEGRAGRAELYYREVDPHELYNLARDPRYKQQRKELRRLANDVRDCVGTACPSDFFAETPSS